MGDTWIEKLIILTSPIGLALLIIGFVIDLWEKHIWCKKRWYYQYWDYLQTKKVFKKGIDEDQLKYFKRWINSYPDHRYIEKFKNLAKDYKPINKAN